MNASRTRFLPVSRLIPFIALLAGRRPGPGARPDERSGPGQEGDDRRRLPEMALHFQPGPLGRREMARLCPRAHQRRPGRNQAGPAYREPRDERGRDGERRDRAGVLAGFQVDRLSGGSGRRPARAARPRRIGIAGLDAHGNGAFNHSLPGSDRDRARPNGPDRPARRRRRAHPAPSRRPAESRDRCGPLLGEHRHIHLRPDVHASRPPPPRRRSGRPDGPERRRDAASSRGRDRSGRRPDGFARAGCRPARPEDGTLPASRQRRRFRLQPDRRAPRLYGRRRGEGRKRRSSSSTPATAASRRSTTTPRTTTGSPGTTTGRPSPCSRGSRSRRCARGTTSSSPSRTSRPP